MTAVVVVLIVAGIGIAAVVHAALIHNACHEQLATVYRTGYAAGKAEGIAMAGRDANATTVRWQD